MWGGFWGKFLETETPITEEEEEYSTGASDFCFKKIKTAAPNAKRNKAAVIFTNIFCSKI